MKLKNLYPTKLQSFAQLKSKFHTCMQANIFKAFSGFYFGGVGAGKNGIILRTKK